MIPTRQQVEEALRRYDEWKPMMNVEDKETLAAAARAWLDRDEEE